MLRRAASRAERRRSRSFSLSSGVVGGLSAVMAAPQANASGIVTTGIGGFIAATISAPTVVALGAPGSSGSVTITMPAPTMAAVGFLHVTGSVSGAWIGAPTMAAVGATEDLPNEGGTQTYLAEDFLATPNDYFSTVPPAVVGQGAGWVAPPTVTAAELQVSGTITASISAPAGGATGLVNYTGTYYWAEDYLATPTDYMVSGPDPLSGTVLIALAAPTLAANGSMPIGGNIAATIALPEVFVSGFVPTDAPQEVTTAELLGTGTGDGAVATFLLTFPQGAIPAATPIVCKVGGTAINTQADWSVTWPDGSARVVLMATENAALGNGVTRTVAVWKNDVFSGGGAPQTLTASAMAGRSASVTVTPAVGTPWMLDLLAADVLDAAPYYRRGAVMAEKRILAYAPGSVGIPTLRIVADVRICKDGVLDVDAYVWNDVIQQPGGTTSAVYAATVTVDGVSHDIHSIATVLAYSGWGKRVRRTLSGPALREPYFIPNNAWLHESGALSYYDKAGSATDASVIATFQAHRAAADWNTPFNTRQISTVFTNGGEPPQLGVLTMQQVIVLHSGHPDMIDYVIEQAEAMAGCPYHLWDKISGGGQGAYIDTIARIDAGTGFVTPTEPHLITNMTPWKPDLNHHPDFYAVPYLLTGRRRILDGMQAGTNWQLYSWPIGFGKRGPTGASGPSEATGNGVRFIDLPYRPVAWAFRTWTHRWYVEPDASAQRAWTNLVVNGNINHYEAQIDTWRAQLGQLAGLWNWSSFPDKRNFQPFMYLYLMNTLCKLARMHTSPKAKRVALYFFEFIMGMRLVGPTPNNHPNTWASYGTWVAPNSSPGTIFTTWQAWYDNMFATGAQTNLINSSWVYDLGNLALTAYGMHAAGAVKEAYDVLADEDPRVTEVFSIYMAAPFPRDNAADVKANNTSIHPAAMPRDMTRAVAPTTIRPNQSKRVASGAAAGAFVGAVRVAGNWSTGGWSITAGNSGGAFSIDTLGRIYAARTITEPASTLFVLSVEKGAASATVTVSVT